jgi:hypothetical protein
MNEKIGDYTVSIEKECKRLFFENDDGDMFPYFHKKTYIILNHDRGSIVCFKITKKGNCYDSRDKGKKVYNWQFVLGELQRMLGAVEGKRIFDKAYTTIY